MLDRKTLTKISGHHELWMQYGYIHSKSPLERQIVEDLVQEMYIKLWKYCTAKNVIKRDGELNLDYIFIVMKNALTDYRKKKHRQAFQSETWQITDLIENDFKKKYNKSVRLGLCRCSECVKDKANFNFYDKSETLISHIKKTVRQYPTKDRLIIKKFLQGKSIRKIAKETKKGNHVVFNAISRFKKETAKKYKTNIENVLYGKYKNTLEEAFPI